MKFWFAKKTPKDVYDVKAPYDATVEHALRAAREVNAAPVEVDADVFDFVKTFRKDTTRPILAPEPSLPPDTFFSPERPTVSRATRDEMERRKATYHAFQMKLNEEREARIRRTMEEVRAQLKPSDAPNSSMH